MINFRVHVLKTFIHQQQITLPQLKCELSKVQRRKLFPIYEFRKYIPGQFLEILIACNNFCCKFYVLLIKLYILDCQFSLLLFFQLHFLYFLKPLIFGAPFRFKYDVWLNKQNIYSLTFSMILLFT